MDRQNTFFIGGCVATISSGALPQDATLSNVSMDLEEPSYKVVQVDDSTTDSIYTTPSLIEKAIDDLNELSKLPVDWDSYGSPKISEDLIMTGKTFLYHLEYENIAPRVVPISGGGIQFEWRVGNRELELEIIDSDTIGFLKVLNEEPIEESNFRLHDFNAGRGLIQWLKGC